MALKRTYGWRHDKPDPRDHLYSAPRKIFGLPKRVDLREYCSPVEDQGQTSSCTGNASVGALEFLYLKYGWGYADLSRLMAYYNGRALELSTKTDSGAQIRDVVHELCTIGTCMELYWPFTAKNVTKKPSAKAYKDALQRRISDYSRIVGLNQMRACLAEGYPVIFGFEVFDSFEGDEVSHTGVMQMPAKGERHLGGHAVLAVGYDDAAKRITVRNSWGEEWGMKGYFTMPYAYIENSRLSSDFWTIRK